MNTLTEDFEVYKLVNELEKNDEIIFQEEVSPSWYSNTEQKKRKLELEEDNEIIFLENIVDLEKVTKRKCLTIEKQQKKESKPIEVIDLEEENEIIFEFKINTVKIRIVTGDLFKTKSKSLFNVIDTNLNLKYYTVYEQRYGQSLFEQLKTYNALSFVPNESIFQIALTNHTEHAYLNKIYHSHLMNYEYQNDLSEIKLKNLIINLLILVKQFNDKSICIPLKYYLDVGYPANFLIELVVTTLNDYINSTDDHKLEEIFIHIDSNEKNFIQLVTDKYSNKLTKDFSLSSECKLEILNPNSEEYKLVFNLFKKTLPNSFIYKIEKVFNPFLKQMYTMLKEATRLKNPKSSPLEWKLFHGTDNNSVYKICESGFNRSYAGKNGTVYGKGVYFARDSSYSHKYVHSFFQNESLMLLSSVIVGQYERGSLNMINTSKDVNGKQFDSSVNDLVQPTIFVIYKDFQALPEYIIHYSNFYSQF